MYVERAGWQAGQVESTEDRKEPHLLAVQVEVGPKIADILYPL